MGNVDGTENAAPQAARVAYRVVEASLPRDREQVRALWTEGLAQGAMQEAKLAWYYDANPGGAPRVFLLQASDSDKSVGVATVAPRHMRLRGEALVAGVLADFVVEKAHRGFFPAHFLQKQLLGNARATHRIIFGTPNARSEAVVRRVGYRCVGHMVRSARVLRSSAYLARYLPARLANLAGAILDGGLRGLAWLRAWGVPRYKRQWADRPGPEFDALWNRMPRSDTLLGVRDSAFLVWRFVDSPFHAHRFFTLTSRKDGRLVAYAACHVRDDAMHVADFLADPAEPGAGMRLWLDLCDEAYRGGHRSLSVSFFGSDAIWRDLERVGMVERARQPVYAAVEPRDDLGSPSNWYVTNADEDG